MLEVQFDFLGLGNHLKDIHDTRDNVIQIEVLSYHTQTTRLTLGPLQQVVQQVMHLFRLSVGLIEQCV